MTQSLTPAGRRLLAAFEKTRAGAPVPSGTYLPETLEAAETVVEAIARSDGSRASVLDQIRQSERRAASWAPSTSIATGHDAGPVRDRAVTGGRGASGLAPDFRGAAVDRTVRAPMDLLGGGGTRRRG